jgi:hypothetical protein
MQANGLNSDASKSDREKLNRMLEEMFEESDMWLVSEFPTFARLAFRYYRVIFPTFAQA